MSIQRYLTAFGPGLVGLCLIGLAACQTSSPYADGEPTFASPKPNFPVRQDGAPGYTPDTVVATTAPVTQVQTQAQPPSPPVVETPPARPSTATSAIEATTLPPATAQRQPEPSPPVVEPAPAAAPPPPPVVAQAPTPPPAPVMMTIATGPVVDSEGPPVRHTVRRGETLSSIARSMGTTVSFLTDRNNIRDPSSIRPGQRINGPATRGKAYVVQQGDTLSAVSRRFSVTVNQLTQLNGTGVRNVIRPGQKIMLPRGYRDVGPQMVAAGPPSATGSTMASATPAPSTSTYQRAPQQSAALAPALPTGPVRPIIPPAPPPSAINTQEVVDLGRGKFVWPIEGQVLGGFGSRGVGQQSNGLSIAAAEGAGVRASAAGTVLYAGSDVPAFGNLVLIEHPDGFVTTYAHLSRIDVREREVVRQNQVVGLVGQTGGVPEPQLYFEMRRRSTPSATAMPFDPTPLLPSR